MTEQTYGWTGNILRVDLSDQRFSMESTMDYGKRFVGGRGIQQWILCNELAPEVGALDPQNLLIFGTGPLTGTRLTTLPSSITTWKKWKRRNPDTTVLSFETGYRRDYSRDPYEDYYKQRKGLFSSFFHPGPGEKDKEMVAGIEVSGSAKAYPVEILRREQKVTDTLGGEDVTITYDVGTDRILAITKSGDEMAPVIAYWFVWKGIYPDTDRYAGP